MNINRFNTWRLRILNLGVKPETPDHVIPRLRLTNAILFTMLIACVFQTAGLALSGAYSMALANSSALPTFSIGLLLMKFGYTRLARMLVAYGGMVGAYFVATQGGMESGFHMLFFFGAALTVAFFPRENKLEILLGFAFSIGIYLVLEITDYQVFFGEPMALSHQSAKNVRIVTFTVVWGLFGTFVAYYMRSSLRFQESLAQSSKMAALGQMAAGMSHELNNPLAIVVGNAELLGKLAAKPVVEGKEIALAADTLVRMGQRMSEIVNGLSMFSREAKYDPPEPVTVSNVIESTLGFCRARIQSLGIELRVRPINKDLTFFGRESQISQVLLNLLNNSVDALMTRESGEKWIEISVVESARRIEIVVIDSGNGIPETVVRRMFEPFFTTKPVGKGTGLGLSIASGIIRTHGGELYYDSNARNTRFVTRLPRSEPN